MNATLEAIKEIVELWRLGEYSNNDAINRIYQKIEQDKLLHEQDEKVEKSLAEIQEELINIKKTLDSDPEFRQRVLELGRKYQKKHSILTAEDLKKLVGMGEQK